MRQPFHLPDRRPSCATGDSFSMGIARLSFIPVRR